MHESQPATAQEWLATGDACVARGELEAALEHFEAALALNPRDPAIYSRLGATFAALNRFSDALVRYREAVALDPANADLHHNVGWMLEQTHQLEEALGYYRESVRLNPQADGSYNNLGNCLQVLGRFDEGRDAYRCAIEVAPQIPLYYRNLVQSNRLSADDPLFIAMKDLMQRVDTLTVPNQAELHFAYGQALADIRQNDASFDHFLQANALHRRGVRYDEAQTLGLFGSLPDLFTADLLKAKHAQGDPSAAPIFIIGMPRSGSTLIEQILASHPQVYGAGERIEFGEALIGFIQPQGDAPARISIDALSAVDAAQWRALGADYLRRLQKTMPDVARHPHFVDKYPFNFMNLGLIHMALPNARFIHSRRSPLQTCLSIFSRIFYDVPFSYDLGELGRYYRAYDALMAHWKRVLPEGVMLEVQYEELVGDLEGHVRSILAHCSLDWDERCLAFHQTERQVSTASVAQVRQPIYKTSLQRWQPQAALLQPLFDALGVTLRGQDGGASSPAHGA